MYGRSTTARTSLSLFIHLLRSITAARGQLANAQYSTSKILFKKTGLEIKQSIEEVVKLLEEKSAKAKTDIEEICKRRELDPNEVIEAGTNENAVQTYSTKAETSMGGGRTNSLIRELQNDLFALRQHAAAIESYKNDIDSLRRTQKNIEPERAFDLSYQELVEFGF